MESRRAGARSGSCASFLCIALFAAGLSTGCGRGTGPDDRRFTDVEFETADGIRLAGTLYHPANENPPGLILIHMLNSNRTHWSHFAEAARQAGYMSLAYDMRGHGESMRRNTKDGSPIVFNTTDSREAVADIAAAKEELITAGVDPENIGIVGAGIGANLALIYAQRDPQIQALVLLSPGESYRGLDILPVMEKYQRRPVMIMAGEGDTYSASSSVELEKRAQGFSELRLYLGPAHGTDLLWTQPSAEGQILQWLDGILKTNPAPSAP